MPLSYIKKVILPEVFIIDEQPVEVWEIDQAQTLDTDPQSGIDAVMDIFSQEEDKGRRDLLTQMTRLLAEQERLARRARELEDAKPQDDEFGRFVRQALASLDGFHHLLEMAREFPPSEELTNWLKSIEALYFRIINLFESYGLVFINSIGKVVDLNYQEVVEYRPTEDFAHNVVMRELQKGVVFRGRLIRDARVVVALNEPKQKK